MTSHHQPVTNETRVRVRYAETDQMGVVYHANHFVWCEIGRVEFMRELGFSYREMEKQDQRCVAVVEVKCRYRAPARYDEEILVRTRLLNAKESVLHFGYELIRASDGTLIAEAETTHIVTDLNMKVAALPEKYLETFRSAVAKSSAPLGIRN